MPWYLFSFIALGSFTIYALITKWVLNLKIPENRYLLFVFTGSLLGLLLINFQSLRTFMSQDLILSFLLWGVLAAVFSFIANLSEVKAIKLAPNTGYVQAVRSANMIPTLFLSVWLFNSSISILKFLGVLVIVSGLMILIIDVNKGERRKANIVWVVLAIIALTALSAMSLSVKKMMTFGFEASQAVLVIIFFATLFFLVNEIFFTSRERAVISKKPLILSIIIVSAIITSTMGDIWNFQAIKLSPNPGYSEAILGLGTVLVTVISPFLFKTNDGGEYNLKRWLSVGIVILGVIFLVI